MIDLKDTEINMSVMIDTQDRIDNINIAINFIKKHYDTTINVCEYGSEKVLNLDKSLVNYYFLESNDEHNHKTKSLNFLCKKTTSNIIVNYDVDVLIPISQFVSAIEHIRSKTYDLVYPYDGRFMNVPKTHKCHIERALNIDFLNESNTVSLVGSNNSVGGCWVWDKSKFITSGMENENFKSWGFEDNERYERSKILGLKIGRMNGMLFHLDHIRTNNSCKKNSFYLKNKSEYMKVKSMNESQLKQYMKTWEWVRN